MAEEELSPNERLWTPGRIIATAVVGLLIATIGYTLLLGHDSGPVEAKVALPGTPPGDGSKSVPADFDLQTIDGRTIKLSDYRGKVLVLDFWATWCGPCRQEVPQLVRIAGQGRARGLEVVGLHIDDRGRSSPADIRKFISQFDVNYTVAMASDDVFTAYLGTEETAIPQTLVFDRNGYAVAHFVSYSEAHARELEEAVNRALAGL